MYQALYRKYRPKNFDEVVGQEHITSVLKQEIASGRIGHAYLFTGSRGTGNVKGEVLAPERIRATTGGIVSVAPNLSILTTIAKRQ